MQFEMLLLDHRAKETFPISREGSTRDRSLTYLPIYNPRQACGYGTKGGFRNLAGRAWGFPSGPNLISDPG